MSVETLQAKLAEFVLASPDNAIQADYALRDEIVGTPLFDAPIVGCAAANDPIFALFKSEGAIIGDTFRLPMALQCMLSVSLISSASISGIVAGVLPGLSAAREAAMAFCL